MWPFTRPCPAAPAPPRDRLNPVERVPDPVHENLSVAEPFWRHEAHPLYPRRRDPVDGGNLLAAPLLGNLFVSLLTGNLSYGAEEPLTGVLHPTLDGDLTPG